MNSANYNVWGNKHIDEEAHQQMENAMNLPISRFGALLPDAHVGYGLPIGGVLATENAVIPYAVGVDIACRMRLTIFQESCHVIGQQRKRFINALKEGTKFGAGGTWDKYHLPEHPIMDDPEWTATGFINSLKDKARQQLGTSGSGNHFVNWCECVITEYNEDLDIKPGQYLALLSHSGSRGLGYQIANRYSKLAMDYHPELDKTQRHLAWFSLDSHFGQEYWLSMQLAGRYAQANHEVIHRQVTKIANVKPAVTIENHHNFAWKETVKAPDGTESEVIVHRKGATPAGESVFGIIPGSMADPGYIVQGVGNQASLSSASHGAGRVMSRNQAKQTITKSQQRTYLKERGIHLIGGGLDESPQAYKDIDEVIEAQKDLIHVVGKLIPRIVRMDGK